jgi:hypothetical protein
MSSTGPGIGALVGIAWGSALTDRDVAKERQRLLDQSREKEANALAQTAQKNAVRAVANAIIGELAAEERGLPVVRRLSDPKNVDARAEDFIDTADAELHRLSSGRLSFSRESIRSVKNAGREVGEYFDRSVSQPTPGPNCRPKKKP